MTQSSWVNEYKGGMAGAELRAEFKPDLDRIGTVLTKRAQLEETRLYTLYAA